MNTAATLYRTTFCDLGHGAEVHRRGVRWEHQAHALPLPRSQDASDPAREGHRHRVHQERGLQVRSIYTTEFQFAFSKAFREKVIDSKILLKKTPCLSES